MKYLELRQEFHERFTFKERFSAHFGGLIFSLLLFMPIFAALVEFMVIYFFMLYFIVVLMIFAAMAFVLVMVALIKKALLLKKPEIKATFSLNRYMSYPLVFFETLILMIGLLFLLVFIPMLLV